MAVTRGISTPSLQTISAPNHSFSHNNDGDVLYVAIAFDNADVTTFTDVQYNSVSMAFVRKIEIGRSIYVYRLINPTIGSNTVFVDYDGTQNNVNYMAVSLSGAHQTTPETGTGTSGGSGTSISIPTIASTVTDLVIGFGYLNNEAIGDVTEGSGQTLINSAGANGVIWASEKAGAASSQSLAWTVTSQSYGAVGISVAASSSVSVTQTDITPEDGVEQAINSSGLTGNYTAFTVGGKDYLSVLDNVVSTTESKYTSDIFSITSEETGPLIDGITAVTVVATATGGAPTTSVTIGPATGKAITKLAGTLNTADGGIKKAIEDNSAKIVVADNIIYYETVDNTAIAADGTITTDADQFDILLGQGGSATTATTWTPFTVIMAASGGGIVQPIISDLISSITE